MFVLLAQEWHYAPLPRDGGWGVIGDTSKENIVWCKENIVWRAGIFPASHAG